MSIRAASANYYLTTVLKEEAIKWCFTENGICGNGLGSAGVTPFDVASKFTKDDLAAPEAVPKRQQDELIGTRTQDLWHAHGLTITEKQAHFLTMLLLRRPTGAGSNQQAE